MKALTTGNRVTESSIQSLDMMMRQQCARDVQGTLLCDMRL